ncbi:rolling circle replication-associated protein [Mycolicibacterium thermoresistibile]
MPRWTGGRERPRPPGGRAGERQRSAGRRPRHPASTRPRPAGFCICAKNVRDPLLDGIAAGELRAIDALGLRFPSPEMVTAAAALFEPAPPWARGPGCRGTEPESGRFRISIGPGVVRLGWTNPARAEKAAEGAVGHHQRDVDDAKYHVRNDLERDVRHDDQAVGPLTRRSPTGNDQSSTGGVITNGPESHGRRCAAPSRNSTTPHSSTPVASPRWSHSTYAGDWELVAPDGASIKRHMVLWRKRFQREYGEPARYIWKLEFQRRGAPHIHLWMAPPISPGRSGRGLAQWLSETWAQIVDHPDAEQ